MKTNDDSKIKKYEITKLIFALLGASFLVGASVQIPVLPFALGTLIKAICSFKGNSISEKKIRRSLDNLKQRNIVSFEERGKEIFIHVNQGWRNQLIKYSLADILNFKTSGKWSGKWYAVFFDVPEMQRNKRDEMRKLLKKLGFYQYQKSVYVFPYECVREIALIKQIVEGGSYLKYAIVETLEGENDLKNYFGLN